MPPGRIASSTSSIRRVADRLPGREALAQTRVGDVAVAVVGALGEDGEDELVERRAVGLLARDAVELAQPVADRADPAARRSPPCRPSPRSRRVTVAHRYGRARARGAGAEAASSTGCRWSGERRPPTAFRCSTCTASRTPRRPWEPFLARTGGRRARPARLRALGQARALRLLDRRLRRVARALRRARRDSSASRWSSTIGVRWRSCSRSGRPSASTASWSSTPCRCCPAIAGTASRGSGARAARASCSWA